MHFLDGKCNQWIDHALFALVKDMITHYEDWHSKQSVRLESPDLLGQQWWEIMANAQKITCNSIQDFGDSAQFHITSLSHPREYHVVDLHWPTCDCKDFPQILFCKHITAIYVHFPNLNPWEKGGITAVPECAQLDTLPRCLLEGGESVQTLSQRLFSLSQKLTSESGALNLVVIEAFQSANYSLVTAIASMEGNSALLEKDVIAPNQKSWPETAQRMGTKKVPKPWCLPEEHGLTECSIGVVKGKHKHLHNDPYAGGERSGKCAKPDAVSRAACHVPTPSPVAPSPATSSPIAGPPHMPPHSAFLSYFGQSSYTVQ